MSARTAIEDVRRRIERAREAIEVNGLFAGDYHARARAAELTAQLEREIADMESELRDLEQRPTPDQIEDLELSREQIKSYRPDTRAAATRHK